MTKFRRKAAAARPASASKARSAASAAKTAPPRHTLEGYYLFDLDAGRLSYVSVRGSQQLLDKDGKTVGKIEGTFVLTRRVETCKELSDSSLRPLKLEPNEENTQLLYDNTELGVRFLHPRRWRVAGVRGPQVAVDENGGSGLLLTMEPLKQTPSATQFLQESKAYLEKEKAKVLRIDPVRQVVGGSKSIEQFALEVEISGQKVLMVYMVIRQGNGSGHYRNWPGCCPTSKRRSCRTLTRWRGAFRFSKRFQPHGCFFLAASKEAASTAAAS